MTFAMLYQKNVNMSKDDKKLIVIGVLAGIGFLFILFKIIVPIGTFIIKGAFLSEANHEGRIAYVGTTTISWFEKTEPGLSEEELLEDFPNYKEDWEFLQEMAGVSGLEIPSFYYFNNNPFYWGLYDSEDHYIDINSGVFEKEIYNFPRYVMMHEMTHAVLDRSQKFSGDSTHCAMVENGFFQAIGERIGNVEYGEKEYLGYKFDNDCLD